tara:strand:- start:320 stop:604 length:285 start_codon:yes stop_codon:yes gene_type:complete
VGCLWLVPLATKSPYHAARAFLLSFVSHFKRVIKDQAIFWAIVFFLARVSSHYIKKQKVQAGRIEPVLLLYCLSFANWYNVISESYSTDFPLDP